MAASCAERFRFQQVVVPRLDFGFLYHHTWLIGPDLPGSIPRLFHSLCPSAVVADPLVTLIVGAYKKEAQSIAVVYRNKICGVQFIFSWLLSGLREECEFLIGAGKKVLIQQPAYSIQLKQWW